MSRTHEERMEMALELKRQLKAVKNFSAISFRATLPTLTKTQVLMCEPLVDEWTPGEFAIGDVRRHGEQVWECAQPHNNANNPDIEPGESPAHWFLYHSKNPEYAKSFIQPQGAHDAYQAGEYMIWTDGKVHVSKIDGNVWTPEGYPAGWELA